MSRMNAPLTPNGQAGRRLLTGVTGLPALIAALFLLRSLVTFPIEHGDAARKYFAAAEICRTGDWSLLLLDHQTMRWSQLIPQVVVTWISGLRYEAAYILPLLAFSAYCASIVWMLRDRLDLRHSILLLAVLFVEPTALTHTGQLLNPPFGVAFSIMGVIALVRSKNDHIGWLALSALMFFCAYGSHVTYVSFAAGGLFWLLWYDRSIGRAAWFAGFLLCLLLLETVAFNALSGGELTFGRLEALAKGPHAQAAETILSPVPAHELLTRWLKIPAFDLVLVAGFLACSGWFLLSRPALAGAPPYLCCAMLSGGAFALFTTFAVLSLDPIRPMMPLRPMYLEPFYPYAAAASVYLFSRVERRIDTRWRLQLELTAGVLSAVLVFAYVASKGPLADTLNNRLNAFMWRSEPELSDFALRFSRGELILRGENRAALAFVARYRYPVAVVDDPESGTTSVPDPHPDALCLSQIRKIPLARNYHDCGAADP